MELCMAESVEEISGRISAIDGVLNAWFELEAVEVDVILINIKLFFISGSDRSKI